MRYASLKIVVSGPTGSGKTTLVNALAEDLGLPVLAEDAKRVFSLESKYRKAVRDGLETKLLDEAASAWAQGFVDWAIERAAKYEKHPNFIADRWEADMLDMWLVKFSNRNVDDWTRWLFNDMRRKARSLDLAIVLPFEEMMGSAHNESGLRRIQNLSGRMLNSLLTRALVDQCPDLKKLYLPSGRMTIAERVCLVKNTLVQ